jgi:multisubunit Na+/H+ antiporter MnhC subunit
MHIDEDILSVIILFGFIPAAIVIYSYIRQTRRHKEKLAMIEKGMDISKFMLNPLYQILMWGILLIGVGIGLLVGFLIQRIFKLDGNFIYMLMAIISGGVSLVAYFYFLKKKVK